MSHEIFTGERSFTTSVYKVLKALARQCHWPFAKEHRAIEFWIDYKGCSWIEVSPFSIKLGSGYVV